MIFGAVIFFLSLFLFNYSFNQIIRGRNFGVGVTIGFIGCFIGQGIFFARQIWKL